MNDLKEKILDGILKSLETFSINKLNDIIIRSEKEKREYGLLFCGSTDEPPFGNISHADLCTGKECTVEIEDCKDKKKIGTFHTHPHVKTGKNFGNLSGTDIYTNIFNKHNFSCIGLIEDDIPIIKCFIPKFDIDPIIALKAYDAQDEYDKKLSKTKEEPNKETIDELIEAYDNRITTENELYRESDALAERLIYKKADLIIKK